MVIPVQLRYPVGLDYLQRFFRLSHSRAIALTPFHSIPLSLKIFFVPPSQVSLGLPLVILACMAI